MPGYVKRGWRNLHQDCSRKREYMQKLRDERAPWSQTLPCSPARFSSCPRWSLHFHIHCIHTHTHTHTLPEPPWEAWRISLFQRPEVKTERGLVSTLLRFIQFYATRCLLGNRPGLWKGHKWSLRSLPSNYLKSNWGNTNIPKKYCRFGFKSLQSGDYCNKVSIIIKWATWFFSLPGAKRSYVYNLHSIKYATALY